ncbi:tRNA dihydrouridine synthase DusB [Candidatus Gracilibacteria bacterium]|nr:tRNA dihydrouridine synthase DusB [Candidatus Gracilibacteria bacterium]MCF7855968.1 tRNA dihydrouridine synthase DusB [Candidatus Gracilibacteria bacterium]MCF7896339.1 tRNA dihydrouridine synthase DusB [Candidatus Gracilibacteria bacterium]
MLNWSKLPKPLIALAPMAGYTDSAFRQLVKSLAPTTIVFSEFVSSDALHYKSQKTKSMLAFSKKEQPFIAQIFGKKPAHFAEAARVVESLGAAGVDLNMGCPARKVVNSLHGSALLKNPKLASEIVEACAKAVKIPVSVKTRLGISDSRNLLDFAKMVEGSGAKLLTIHGRTAKQMYLGEADFAPIYEVKKILKIPVIGNGDIDSADKFLAKIGNLDGLMIGRAAVTNPWIFREIENQLSGRNSRTPKTLQAKLSTILRHAKLMVRAKGEQRGMLEMRKFLANYVKGEAGAKKLRAKLVLIETLAELEKILKTK